MSSKRHCDLCDAIVESTIDSDGNPFNGFGLLLRDKRGSRFSSTIRLVPVTWYEGRLDLCKTCILKAIKAGEFSKPKKG